MQLIDGKKIAAAILEETQKKITTEKRKPGLSFVLVGEHPASKAYVRMKKKKCAEVGIASFDHELPENTSEEELLEIIARLNRDSAVDGILVQLPLPKHIDEQKVIAAIDPQKDVDGFHPVNIGKSLLGIEDGFLSCTPYGVVEMLHRSGHAPAGKHVVIVGRSNIVGKPLAAMLMQKSKRAGATVTVAHSQTQNLEEVCRSADILIAAMGSAKFIKKSFVKEGAVVIDVGINRTEEGIVGDVDFDEVKTIASAISPVPGGVGPMTIAMLLSNTVRAFISHT